MQSRSHKQCACSQVCVRVRRCVRRCLCACAGVSAGVCVRVQVCSQVCARRANERARRAGRCGSAACSAAHCMHGKERQSGAKRSGAVRCSSAAQQSARVDAANPPPNPRPHSCSGERAEHSTRGRHWTSGVELNSTPSKRYGCAASSCCSSPAGCACTRNAPRPNAHNDLAPARAAHPAGHAGRPKGASTGRRDLSQGPAAAKARTGPQAGPQAGVGLTSHQSRQPRQPRPERWCW